MKKTILPFLMAALLAGANGAHAGLPVRHLVVMMFPGLSPAAVEANPTPAFDRMRAEGAWTHRLLPVFPSEESVNAFTISTGCWPERHGIVSGRFLDPVRGLYDGYLNADWNPECRHMSEIPHSKRQLVGAFGWPGRFRGPVPQAGNVSQELRSGDFAADSIRVEQILRFIKRGPRSRPKLLLAYFRGPKGAAEQHGIDSEELRQAVIAADDAVGQVLASIDEQPDHRFLGVAVISPHGMMPVEKAVNVNAILRKHGIAAQSVASGTTAFLYFDPAEPAAVDAAYQKLAGYEQFQVSRPGETPEGWHLGTSERVGQLILSAHPPYVIEDAESRPELAELLSLDGPEIVDLGDKLRASSGYAPELEGTHGVFYAVGSRVQKGREIPELRAVDVQATVLGIGGYRESEGGGDGKIVDAVLDRELRATQSARAVSGE